MGMDTDWIRTQQQPGSGSGFSQKPGSGIGENGSETLPTIFTFTVWYLVNSHGKPSASRRVDAICTVQQIS